MYIPGLQEGIVFRHPVRQAVGRGYLIRFAVHGGNGMLVCLPVILSAVVHFLCQHESKGFDKALVQGAIQGTDHARPGVTVVPDHLLLDVLRLRPALKEIHGLLQGDLCSLHKAGEEHFLRHRAGHRRSVGIKALLLLHCLRAEPFAGCDHLLRQHIPVRHPGCVGQRKNDRSRLSAVQQLRPEGIDGNIQRELEEHLLPGKVMLLEVLKQSVLIHCHPSHLLSWFCHCRRPGAIADRQAARSSGQIRSHCGRRYRCQRRFWAVRLSSRSACVSV